MEQNRATEIQQVEESNKTELANAKGTEIQHVEESNKTESANAKGTEIQQQVEESSKTKLILNVKGRMPPLNFLAIVKDVVPPIDTSDIDKLCDQLYSGVFINPNILKYWVDKEFNKNCFAMYARELDICWSDDSTYWSWTKEKEASGEEIEVAELLKITRLEIKGTFQTIDLSPKTVYEVVFVVKLKSSADLSTVDLSIILPNSRRKVRQESLEKMSREEWIEIQVGEFEMSPENVGEVSFCLENYNGNSKQGLVAKCAIFRPKNN